MPSNIQPPIRALHVGTDTWLPQCLESVRYVGYAIVEGVLNEPFLARTREAMYRCQAAIARDVGDDRLARAGELGVLRLMMKYEPHFLEFLALPELLAVVDATVSPTAILHLQNGFILPSSQNLEARGRFQSTYHRDFPRVLGGYLASMNVFFAIDDFTETNGATWVIPGTHHRDATQADHAQGVCLACPAGSMIVFDSTLWHAAGRNVSGQDRLAINHQFTRSFFKQQIDYVRAMGDEVVTSFPSRTQQLLGWYTRVVTSLDEYYRPSDQRLYRSGQG
jgi:ectoine hydroxylase-related dioxygenase (phytanoyl-CoA dioxygenase family)